MLEVQDDSWKHKSIEQMSFMLNKVGLFPKNITNIS